VDTRGGPRLSVSERGKNSTRKLEGMFRESRRYRNNRQAHEKARTLLKSARDQIVWETVSQDVAYSIAEQFGYKRLVFDEQRQTLLPYFRNKRLEVFMEELGNGSCKVMIYRRDHPLKRLTDDFERGVYWIKKKVDDQGATLWKFTPTGIRTGADYKNVQDVLQSNRKGILKQLRQGGKIQFTGTNRDEKLVFLYDFMRMVATGEREERGIDEEMKFVLDEIAQMGSTSLRGKELTVLDSYAGKLEDILQSDLVFEEKVIQKEHIEDKIQRLLFNRILETEKLAQQLEVFLDEDQRKRVYSDIRERQLVLSSDTLPRFDAVRGGLVELEQGMLHHYKGTVLRTTYEYKRRLKKARKGMAACTLHSIDRLTRELGARQDKFSRGRDFTKEDYVETNKIIGDLENLYTQEESIANIRHQITNVRSHLSSSFSRKHPLYLESLNWIWKAEQLAKLKDIKPFKVEHALLEIRRHLKARKNGKKPKKLSDKAAETLALLK